MAVQEQMRMAVRAGAELLDEKRPEWHGEIDLEALDIGSISRCVLGQLYGDYYVGRARVGMDRNTTGVAYGFCGNPTVLNALWREEIAVRKGVEDLISPEPVCV